LIIKTQSKEGPEKPMASTQTNLDIASAAPAPAGSLLVSLAPLPPDALEAMLANLALAFPTQPVLVATPEAAPPSVSGTSLHLLPYTSTAVSTAPWVHTAADYLNAVKLVQENQASACLLLGAESQTLQPEAIQSLAAATTSFDLAVARYNLGPREGLVNSAILYPVTRALFAARPRFPLAIDLGLSRRMVERLAAESQRFAAGAQNDALIWPVATAASANFTITEIDAGSRTLPQPVAADLNSLLAQITGSLFTDVDAKATFWQRARTSQAARPITQPNPPVESPPDVSSMLNAFQLAYTNLHEIWSLVLPPNSLLGLKRLAAMPPASFRMPDGLWSRIVYDFILAYRLRTINRGHLLGALTPLYLAWAASHLLLISSGTAPEKHIEDLAAVFEADKPYLVSRWRWPDRFNP
jgi:glucosylglycerate synthase